MTLRSLRLLRTVIYISHGTLSSVYRLHHTAVCRQWKRFQRVLTACLLHFSNVWIGKVHCFWLLGRMKNFLAPLHRHESAQCLLIWYSAHLIPCLTLLRPHRARRLLSGSPRPKKYRHNKWRQLMCISAFSPIVNFKFVCTLVSFFVHHAWCRTLLELRTYTFSLSAYRLLAGPTPTNKTKHVR